MELLEKIPYELDDKTLFKKLRAPEGNKQRQLIQEAAEKARAIMQPKAVYKAAYVYEKEDNTVKVDDVVFKSRVLRVNLEDVGRIFPYVVTCGKEFDQLSASCTDFMQKYYLDEIANISLGNIQAYLINHLEEKYSLGPTSRMNPGSLGDWPIEQQQQLFSLLDQAQVKEKIGVGLSPTFLMVPVKSVSGIVFPTEKNFKSCQLCPRDDCPSRKAKYNEELLKSYYPNP